MNPLELRCEHCAGSFLPAGAQARLWAHAQATGMRFVMLDCPLCHHGTGADPMAPGLPRAATQAPGVPCPDPDCDGEACFVDTLQPPVWGCGHCGSTWPDRAALDAGAAGRGA
ncbi:hypothetical protein [Stenotrophomonas sp.]|uniref:hypothetical protein n=1 Tax=Stenotrophomonas sp. TaxID=69392 RepID=UPI002FC5924B